MRCSCVFQAIDCGGKDGTIRNVFGGGQPAGLRVDSFKAPSAVELAHDFLWRVAPGRAARGDDRHLQPLALRGRADRAGARAGAGGSVASSATSRSTPSRSCCATNGTTVSSSSCTSPRTSRSSGCRTASTTRRSAGSSTPATSRSGPGGTTIMEAYDDRAPALQHAVGALVRDPGRPQLVPQRRDRPHPLSDAGGDGPEIPEADGRFLEDCREVAPSLPGDLVSGAGRRRDCPTGHRREHWILSSAG